MSILKSWLEGSTSQPAGPAKKAGEQQKVVEKPKNPGSVNMVDTPTGAENPSKTGKKRRKRGGRRGGNQPYRHAHPRNATRDPGGFVKPQKEKRSRLAVAQCTPLDQKKIIKTSLDNMDEVMRVVPIGGCEEVGRNIEGIFYKDEIIVIDCGVQFGNVATPGVDYILPNSKILEERKERVKGILITHGHLDHIGALPYILPKLGFPPLYGTKLTLGFAKAQLEEFDMVGKVQWRVINPAEPAFKVGKHFTVDFFRVNHSIPDACGIAITTPTGTLVHTGDFKFDFTPADGLFADIPKMTAIGKHGVDLLMSDSTNALQPGYTISESVVIEELKNTIRKAKGRVMLATFASLIGRIQHVINAAHKANRKVFVTGRSMIRNIKMAVDLGYLKAPPGILRDLQRSRKEFKSLPDERIMIICTGSQGEELAALSRIAAGSHPDIKLKKPDTVIFSSTPIPGNESAVASVLDNLARREVEIITNHNFDIHTSGHGHQEDLKLMLRLMQPHNLAPVHGLHFMRAAHGRLGIATGLSEQNILHLDNGDVAEIHPKSIVNKAEYHQEARSIYIDGYGIGDVTSSTISDRIQLSENGCVVMLLRVNNEGILMNSPELTVRGFGSPETNQRILTAAAEHAREAWVKHIGKGREHAEKEAVLAAETIFSNELDREPIVLPIVVKA